jgi:type I restriction enzyme M protein
MRAFVDRRITSRAEYLITFLTVMRTTSSSPRADLTEGKQARCENLHRMANARSELGQFFTPRAVVRFALSLLEHSGASLGGASVCDPACGPGEWLAAALEVGAAEVLGMDCDPAMPRPWRKGGLADDSRAALAIADSLDPALRLAGRADLVLGNPPFGTQLEGATDLQLGHYAEHYRLPLPGQALTLIGPPPQALARLRRYPRELLFLERFVEICRPDGWIAIVLPEGVFSNRRWRYVREWLLARVTLQHVVGLPRATFRAHATAARTCLAIMQRRPPELGHEVVLSVADDCTAESLDALLRLLRDSSAAEEQAGLPDLTPPIFRD